MSDLSYIIKISDEIFFEIHRRDFLFDEVVLDSVANYLIPTIALDIILVDSLLCPDHAIITYRIT